MLMLFSLTLASIGSRWAKHRARKRVDAAAG